MRTLLFNQKPGGKQSGRETRVRVQGLNRFKGLHRQISSPEGFSGGSRGHRLERATFRARSCSERVEREDQDALDRSCAAGGNSWTRRADARGEVEEIKENEKEVSSDVSIDTIVMPIRITFDNPIDFNDHFSKPKDLKKDLTISFDSTTKSSILPHPLLDSDSPFTAELSASVILNSLGNEDKVFKPGILVYHAIHDKNLITLEENLKENISSGTLLVSKEPSFLLPPPEPPDECLKNVVLNFYQNQKPIPIEDVNTFAFIIWTFLPHFTYSKKSPVIFSFRSENFVFDPGIITFHNLVDSPNKFFEASRVRCCFPFSSNGPKVKAMDVIIARTWNLVDRSLTSAKICHLSDIVPSTVDTRTRISDKRTKNEAKNNKTEHGMEEREKDKVKSKPKSTKVKVKVNPAKSQGQSQSRKRRNVKWAHPYPSNGPGQPI
ncbi:hypothetical protein Tco_0167256 [Tanacetum coccineum]